MMNRAFVRGGWQQRVSLFFFFFYFHFYARRWETYWNTYVPKLVDASCEIYTITVFYLLYIYFTYFFLNKTRPITIFNSNYSFSWLAHAKVLSIRWMSLSISRERWREINLEQFKDESNLERITRILVADFFPCWFKYHDFFHRVIEEKFYRFPRPKFSS